MLSIRITPGFTNSSPITIVDTNEPIDVEEVPGLKKKLAVPNPD